VRARAELTGTLEAVPSDPSITIEPVRASRTERPALVVTSGGGRVSLIVSDAIMNSTKESMGFFPRMMGFAGPMKIVPIFRMMFLKDKKALKSQIERWAGLSGLVRLIPSHGNVASGSVSEGLRGPLPPFDCWPRIPDYAVYYGVSGDGANVFVMPDGNPAPGPLMSTPESDGLNWSAFGDMKKIERGMSTLDSIPNSGSSISSTT